MKNLTAAPDWTTSLPIAHRGYHDLAFGRAENSMGSFHAAVAAGFAIECDLQITKTGEPVVFHDPVLGRMTGHDGNVRDFAPNELGQLKLLDTTDCIYPLSTHLRAVSGAVPLILELKGVEGHTDELVEGVTASLRGYEGPVCVMSFDHAVLKQFSRLLPDIPRGLTAEGGDEDYDTHVGAMKEFDLQFVSYYVKESQTRFCREIVEAGLPMITWTVRDASDREATDAVGAQMTFEGFDPRKLDPRDTANGA